MAKWRMLLNSVDGGTEVGRIVADEATVERGGHLLLQTDGKIVAAIVPGRWFSVEKELDT